MGHSVAGRGNSKGDVLRGESSMSLRSSQEASMAGAKWAKESVGGHKSSEVTADGREGVTDPLRPMDPCEKFGFYPRDVRTTGTRPGSHLNRIFWLTQARRGARAGVGDPGGQEEGQVAWASRSRCQR